MIRVSSGCNISVTLSTIDWISNFSYYIRFFLTHYKELADCNKPETIEMIIDIAFKIGIELKISINILISKQRRKVKDMGKYFQFVP